MSRNIIVGLSVAIVAALAWIAIDRVAFDAEPALATDPVIPTVADPGPILPPDPEAAAQASDDAALAASDAAPASATDAGAAARDATAAGGETPEPGAAEQAAGAALRPSDDTVRPVVPIVSPNAPAADAAAPDQAPAGAVPDAPPPAEETSNDTAPPPDLATLLTEDGFDAAALQAALDARDLSAPVRANLRAAVDQAAAAPERLPGLLEQLRARFDVE